MGKTFCVPTMGKNVEKVKTVTENHTQAFSQ